MTELYAMAGLNALLCIPCLFICICRLNAMQRTDHARVKWQVKVTYAVGTGAFFLSACSPWIGQWPGVDSLVMSGWALCEMLSSRDAWHNDTPPPTASEHAELLTPNGGNP